MELDLSLTPCSGRATGAVYQFAEGRWPDTIVGGVVLREAAFDFIEPLVRKAWPEWNGLAMYGVTNISSLSCIALVEELRHVANGIIQTEKSPEWAGYSDRFTPDEVRRQFDKNPERLDELASFFRELANWLEGAMARGSSVSLLGI